jgi:dihydrofolate reductase
VTHVLADVDGDARFPDIDPQLWQPVEQQEVPAGEKDSHATRYVVYEKRV